MIKKNVKKILLIALALPVVFFGVVGRTSRVDAYTAQSVGPYDNVSRVSHSTSIDGRYVAFISGASIVSGDTNNTWDAYIKDMKTGTVNLLSVTPSGAAGSGSTNGAVILTNNARYALFSSEATNLSSVPGGGAWTSNVYLRDLSTSTTYLIAKGNPGSGINHYALGMSEDGRFVYYSTQGGTGAGLYALDRVLNSTNRIDVDSLGNPANFGVQGGGDGSEKRVSCDGRYVVVASSSTNLTTQSDTNGVADILLFDRMNGQIIKNITINANGRSDEPEISCDGNYILFWSQATNLVSSDTNNAADLFKYKVSDGSVERVSVKADGSEYPGGPTSVDGGFQNNVQYDMSMDGRYVFYIYAKYSTSANNNYLTVRDTQLGTSTVIAPSGSNYYPISPIASYDGKTIYYTVMNSFSNPTSLSLYTVTGHI